MSKVLLYVDNSEDDLFLFSAACKMACVRFHVIQLNGGPKAILYLDRRDIYADRDRFPDPDITLLDLKMPEVDGFAVLQHLRSNPARAAWPVALFTSSDWPGDIEQARKLGATWYFHKPPDMKHLVKLAAILDECMEQSPAACEAASCLSIFNAA
jgi:CheY-like chemotaxis protein